MTVPYLRAHQPRRGQYRSPRRDSPTGLTVVHTAESVMDKIGPDTGAEGVAAFIRNRTDPGSYHDLVDSDTALQLVAYGDEAYQDGTGSNRFALSISFACRTTDWAAMSADRRDAFLRQGAVAFGRQQAWLKAHGHPTTPLRRVSRAQSEAGAAGFIAHGDRDPGRRSDPGAAFPWARFFDLIRNDVQEDDMPLTKDDIRALGDDLIPRLKAHLTPAYNGGKDVDPGAVTPADVVRSTIRIEAQLAALRGAVAQLATGDVDMAAIEAAIERSVHEALGKLDATVTLDLQAAKP